MFLVLMRFISALMEVETCLASSQRASHFSTLVGRGSRIVLILLIFYSYL